MEAGGFYETHAHV